MTLPALKVGQVWQCREQAFTVKLMTTAHGGNERFIGTIFYRGMESDSGIAWLPDQREDCYVRFFHQSIPHKHNLTVLLYDPSGA